MTNEEYNVFMYAVDENLHRVDRIARANQYQVALVVSMDIYYLMVAHAQNPIYTGDTYGEYHGVPIAVVSPEHGMTEFAEPAIIGMVYDPMMLEGDIIVVGEDNSLYRLESREPLQFTNMGVTVQFGPTTFNAGEAIETEQQVTTPITETVPTVADVANTTTMTIAAGGMFTGTLADTVNVDALRDAVERAYRPIEDHAVARKKTKKEEELKPGDTKALDEFLDSFIRHGT